MEKSFLFFWYIFSFFVQTSSYITTFRNFSKTVVYIWWNGVREITVQWRVKAERKKMTDFGGCDTFFWGRPVQLSALSDIIIIIIIIKRYYLCRIIYLIEIRVEKEEENSLSQHLRKNFARFSYSSCDSTNACLSICMCVAVYVFEWWLRYFHTYVLCITEGGFEKWASRRRHQYQ